MLLRSLCSTMPLRRCYHVPTHMKAVVLSKYADSVADLNPTYEFPSPQPQHLKGKQALIKVHASSINPIDIEMTRGFASRSVNFMRTIARMKEFPLILGRDFSGEVVACGNQCPHKVGDEVYGVRWILGHGTHAEYAVVNPFEVCTKPAKISHNEAASFAAVATTVWYTLINTKVVSNTLADGSPPKKILIPAGAGGVGTIATQLCKLYGHDVVATCAPDAIPLLNDLGIENVIDYTSPTYKKELKEAGPFDVILGTLKDDQFENSTSFDFFWLYLKKSKSSRFVSLQSPILADTDNHGLILGAPLSMMKLFRDMFVQFSQRRGFYMWGFAGPDVRVLDKLKPHLEDGSLRPVIDKVFSIDDALEGYKYMESGHARGKTVLSMIDE